MNQIIGTCSLCGGVVTKYFGAWGGINPPASCQRCGAIEDTYHLHAHGHPATQTIRMRRNLNGGGGFYGDDTGYSSGVLQSEIDHLKKVNQELLEALKVLVNEPRIYSEESGWVKIYFGSFKNAMNAISLAQAAIAKAEAL